MGKTMDALSRLAMLHREMQVIEARMVPQGIEQQHARDEAKQRLQRLREQRVRRPLILFSRGVSSKTGYGLEKLREALAALMKDQRLLPHVGMKVPSHVDATASAGLRALFAQPYASLRDLEREAAVVGIDEE